MKGSLKKWFHIILVKPYKHYSDDNKYLGKYVIHCPDIFGLNDFNIEFTPVDGIKIDQAVKESIRISDKWQMRVWMNWFNIRVDVPYKTNSDDKSIQTIIDDYLQKFKRDAAASRCVGG